MFEHFLVNNFVHDLEALHGFLLSNADVRLLERHRSVSVVEEVESLLWIDAQKGGNVLVVGQSRTQTNETYLLLCRLNVTNSPKHITPYCVEPSICW